MLEIITSGQIDGEQDLVALLNDHDQIVLPNDEDADLTHWWTFRDNGLETVYVGTPATFAAFVSERNGGVQ